MSGILTVEPEGIEKRIHPRALEHFRKFQANVRLAVPLEEITEADLNNYLRDDEKPEFQRCMNQITDGLRTCLDIADGDSPHGQLKPSLFELGTVIPMFSIRQLLKKVYGRKLKSIREQQKRMEEEERRQAAYRALNVPAADAEKYLAEPGEHEKFVESIAGAVDAYLDKGQSYLEDSRAKGYSFYCDQMKQRKGREQHELAVAKSARLFNNTLNEKIDRLKASLYLHKQSPTKYFGKDSRHTGQKFYGLLSHGDKNDLFDTVQAMAKKELDYLLPGELGDFTGLKHKHYYRLLPTVKYVLDDIPCLDFSFDTEVVVEAEIWLKPNQKTFGGYLFDLPVIKEEHYFVQLREPKFLGYYYLHFDASKLPSIFWLRIPLVLIASLTHGETEPPGAKVLETSKSRVIYRIENFKNEIIIPINFINFLKVVWGLEGMVNMGIMTQQVADIVQRKLTEVGATPMKQTPESAQRVSYSKEEFISKMAGLSFSRKDSEISLQHIPRDLGLDEALKWSLEHYPEIVLGNDSADNSLT